MGIIDSIDGELSYSKGEGGDSEADAGVEDSVFGFFNFVGVTRRCHITNTANDDDNDTCYTKYTNDSIDNLPNNILYGAFAFSCDIVNITVVYVGRHYFKS